ncbi:MAG: 5-formyltetrahydrofolate cyclo-ligase [Bdellovibrionales bacterium]
METVLVEKTALRVKYKNLRREFAKGDGRLMAKPLNENLKRFLRDFDDAQVCLYQARPDEAPCLLSPTEKFFYPVMNGEDLEFRRPHTAKAFRSSKQSILEPIAQESEAMDPAKPTVVCCPAVAIDGQGVRLGLGKGYYDRFFARHAHVLRVGVVFHVQFSTDPLPAESWDQQLDWIVSERMILRTSTRSSQSWI